MGLRISELFGIAPDVKLPRKIKYLTYQVHDDNVAAQLFEWHHKAAAAHREIMQFVKDKFTTTAFSYDVPGYDVDENGRLAVVNNNGYCPDGWALQPIYCRLYPESIDAVKEVDQLPRMPTLRSLADTIDWPYFTDYMVPKDQKQYMWEINKLLKPWGDGQNTFIDTPVVENFRDFPQVQSAIQNWQPPAFLSLRQQAAPHIIPRY